MQQQNQESRVQTQHIADSLGVTPGTATVMIKHLAESGYVDYLPRQGVILSDLGRSMALRLLRYHRLIETFLMQIVGYDWSEVHDEAEILEHAVSPLFIEKIDTLLGHPEQDPHGDPIPSPKGTIPETNTIELSSVEAGKGARIFRFEETSAETLGLMSQKGLGPGVKIVISENSPAAGIITVEGPKGSFTMAQHLAQSIQVLLD